MADTSNSASVRDRRSRLTPRLYHSGHMDWSTCRSVDFYGPKLSDPLEEAARYLRKLEELPDKTPRILCMHEEFSWEDDGSDLAWHVTLVFSDPVIEA